jgi:MSHA biogenesis protein MshQ
MKRLLAVALTPLLALVLLVAAAPARAQYYTPDSSAAVAAAYPWIDVTAGGTQLPLNDDQVSANINLGFTFNYGGTNYTRVRIAANGMLFFGGITTAYQNSPLPLDGNAEPSIDALMLPLWDDYQPDGMGTYLRYRRSGTAPNRVFVVSWLSMPYYCWNRNGTNCDNDNQTTGTSATFQVQIYEQGHFVYRYGAVDGSGGAHSAGSTYTNPAGGTVGYELDDANYVQFAYQNPAVTNGTTILWSRSVATPGGFNAFETSTAAGNISGVIKTKIAGTPFDLAVVALNAGKTAVATGFTGDVKVELIDSSDNTGALDTNTGCRASWTTVLATSTLNFASADAGRDNLTLSHADAWPDLRLRMSYPAAGPATVVACSTDNVAIRPSAFTLAATDTDWTSAGTGRALNNGTAVGGNVHKAGRPFTVSGAAVNTLSATTGNYAGTPVATVSACAGTACTASFGTLSVSLAAVAGVINNTTASYGEAGAFTLQLDDSSFAGVDAADSTLAERTISSPAITVGRFVPDHFDLAVLATPQLRTFNTTTCDTRSFTYVGQPFGYVAAPQATVLARNASGGTTTLYAGALWKLVGGSPDVVQGYSPLAPASPGLDVGAVSQPALSSNGDGTGVLAANPADLLRFTRPATAPLTPPFNAAISLNWTVSDPHEAGVPGNGTITASAPLVFSSIAFDAGSEFRYGVLKLANGYGSELNNLPAVIEAQYWNGSAFVTNGADHCTTLASGSVAMGNYQRNLSACETAITPVSVRLASGRAVFTLRKPGNGNSGSVDLTLELGGTAGGQTCPLQGAAAVAATAANMPWLQGRWGSAVNYDTNPRARASFGQYKSPLLYLRESF